MCNDLLNYKLISFHFTKNNMSENYLVRFFVWLFGGLKKKTPKTQGCVLFCKSKDLDLFTEVEPLISRGTII